MRYIWQHISIIISSYKGAVPLTHFIRNYCRQHPKLGSRDRKMLSDMAYSWYRCARGVEGSDIIDVVHFEATMRACLTLCGHEKIIERLFDNKDIHMSVFNNADLFPYDNVDLSAGIERSAWLASMLHQPALFIRVRKDEERITALLYEHDIPFTFITENCISLPNGAHIDELLPEDCYVVQDASSQETAKYFEAKKGQTWYDCCSGAGGKSLLLKDLEPGVQLTVTDVRESILHNLKERFRQYHLAAPMAYVTNVSDKEKLAVTLGARQYDNIICDAPCSGSGTWARTPEQMYFFDPGVLGKFSTLQATIAANVAAYLKPGGKLFYITCSVFRAENEDVAAAVAAQTGLAIQRMELINGISRKSDSMFVAVLG